MGSRRGGFRAILEIAGNEEGTASWVWIIWSSVRLTEGVPSGLQLKQCFYKFIVSELIIMVLNAENMIKRSENKRQKISNVVVILGLIMLLITSVILPAGASIQTSKFEIHGSVADASTELSLIPSWNAKSFGAFYYELKYDRQTESLKFTKPLSYFVNSRLIDKDVLWYNTTKAVVDFKVFEKENLSVDKDLSYGVVGWQGEKWIATNGAANKLTKLVLEMGKQDIKTMKKDETWSLGSGYEITINAINTNITPGQVNFSLKKNGALIDEAIVQAASFSQIDKQKAVYFKKLTILGESNALLFTIYVDQVFRNSSEDFVQFKYAWLIDKDSVVEIKSGDRYGVFQVRTANPDNITLSNENTVSLYKNTEPILIRNIKFRVADNDSLIFYPLVEYTAPGIYELRGNVVSEEDGSLIPFWDGRTFGAFYYDIKYSRQPESLQFTKSLSTYTSNRSIGIEELWYNTTKSYVDFKVWEKEMVTVNSKSNYYFVGWQAEKWIGINDKANKLAKLAFEMGIDDKNTLTTGETWTLGSGYELTINAINATTIPRQVWFTLKKDGAVVDEGIGEAPQSYSLADKQKAVYFKTKTIQGESDALLFTIYVDTIFTGATSDMVQFKYAWLIDEGTAKEIKAGDTFGVFEVREAKSDRIIMTNLDSVNVSMNTEITLMGDIKFKIADNNVLRFYPEVDYIIGGGEIPTIGPVHNINKGTNYTAIQAAIDDASPGDEIHVDSGTYYEYVNVNKQLILKGVGLPIIDGSNLPNQHLVSFNANGIILEGFVVKNTTYSWQAAIYVNGFHNNIIKNNIIENSNNITANLGIQLRYSENNIIENNIITNWNRGINIINSSNNILKGNNISYSNNGIDFRFNCNNNILSDNIFSKNSVGLLLYEDIYNNIIYNNYFNNTNHDLWFLNPYPYPYNKWNISETYNPPQVNIMGGTSFGGNYWANPSGTGFSQTCANNNHDSFCDTPYSVIDSNFYGYNNYYNIDYLPLSYKFIETPIVPTQPIELNQLKSDGITQINVNAATDEHTVVFSARVIDTDGDNVKLQIELRRNDEYDNNFDENQGGLKNSSLVTSGSEISISVSDLIDGNYHWRARAIDEHENKGEWAEFGGNPTLDTDFVVNTAAPLPDLTVTGISFSKDNPVEGEPITITATIKNIGNADAKGDITVYFSQESHYTNFIDNEKGRNLIFSNPSISEIKVGESVDVEALWNAATVITDNPNGTINITVDGLNTISETNEDNNKKYGNPTVSSPPNNFISMENGYHFRNFDPNEKEKDDMKKDIKSYIDVITIPSLNPVPFVLALKVDYTSLLKTGGLCYGISSTSILYNQNSIPKPINKDTFDMLRTDQGVTTNILRYQAMQVAYQGVFASLLRMIHKSDFKTDYNKIAYRVKNGLPVIIQIEYYSNGIWQGRHAVTAYEVYESGSIKNMLVYDSNFPGMARVMQFDQNNNEIVYDHYSYNDRGIWNAKYYSFDVPLVTWIDSTNIMLKELNKDIANYLYITKHRIFSFHSPVNITIIDQYGRVMNDEGINEIPGADADIGLKMFSMPTDLDYTIYINAYDSGNVSMIQMDPLTNESASIISFMNIWVNENTRMTIEIKSTNSNYIMKIDDDGDGIIDTTKVPDSVEVIIVDSIPPTTNVLLSGTPGNNGWYISNVSVNLTAIDNAGGSGVNKTEYSFDNATWFTYNANFTVTTEGTTTLYYQSIDNAGNVEPTKNQTIKIDKTPLSDFLSFTISLKSGWNLISAPLNLTTWELGNETEVGDSLNVTPRNCISSIYRYNTTSKSFEKSDHFDNWGWYPATGSEIFTKLEPGRGYWVMAQQDCSLAFTGTEPSDLDISLDKGWNLIGWYSMNEGALGEEALAGNPLNVTPANNLTSIYRYNIISALFEKSDHFPDWGWYPATGSEGFTELQPGRGYWVMAQNDAVWRHKR